MEDFKGRDGRITKHHKESSLVALRQDRDGTEEEGLHSRDKALPLNPVLQREGAAGRQGQGGDINNSQAVGRVTQMKKLKHRQWTQGKGKSTDGILLW